jgi:hypothetical protein
MTLSCSMQGSETRKSAAGCGDPYITVSFLTASVTPA